MRRAFDAPTGELTAVSGWLPGLPVRQAGWLARQRHGG
ncbi:hypothetical protein RR42_m0984 [Cupriavidus basilensis]|uniref:Uncharacterized protein n=1 Tax=Cupriavidus basilensis TaxID=68895 RepID=A0A0C4Y5W3_9BURK|nr:hypothetical protein RR42_m0984 [Cupriavidus basilensis]